MRVTSNHNRRRGITSASLADEQEQDENDGQQSDKNQNNDKNSSSPRLSGLKKLGSLYREFEHDDEEYFEKIKSKRSTTTTTAKSSDTNMTKTNNNKMLSLNKISEEKPMTTAVQTELLDEMYINHRLKLASELQLHRQQGSNLVLDRIMKFEEQSKAAAIKDDDKNKLNVVAKTGIRLEKFLLINTNSSSSSISMTSSNSNSNMVSPSHQEENKQRVNSEFMTCASSSDEHSSKDDGFETQSNASKSEEVEIITSPTQHMKNKENDDDDKYKEEEEALNRSRKKLTNPMTNTINNIRPVSSSTSNVRKSVAPRLSYSTKRDNNNSFMKLAMHHQDNGSQNKNQPTMTTTNLNLSLNDIHKKKSGSALYLNDTASTKAKRASNIIKVTTNNKQSKLNKKSNMKNSLSMSCSLNKNSSIDHHHHSHYQHNLNESVFDRLTKNIKIK
jgi:hypothetical protein